MPTKRSTNMSSKIHLRGAPRQLDDTLRAIIHNKTKIGWLFWIAGIPLLIPGIVLLVVAYRIGRLDQLDIMSILGYAYVGISILTIIGMFVFKGIKKRKYVKLFTEGQVHRAKVERITETWNIRMNGWPRRTIEFTMLGQKMQMHTFSPDMVKLFQDKNEVEMLYHPDMPSMVLPVASLTLQSDMISKQEVPRKTVSF